jgi:hypothetical protein
VRANSITMLRISSLVVVAVACAIIPSFQNELKIVRLPRLRVPG